MLMGTALAAVPTACSYIDDNQDDCVSTLWLDYELRLVTNMTTELETQLTAETDVVLARQLRQHLGAIFTDHAHDVDLSFYDVGADSARLHHEEHIMDANQSSYTLYIPRRQYMHTALANLAGNNVVSVVADDLCHTQHLATSALSVSGGSADRSDTLSSHATGLFTARLPMEMQESGDQTFHVRLYMANCAVALIVDPRGYDASGLQVFASGFATQFHVADSAYSFAATPPVVRTAMFTDGTTAELGFCAVSFPSPEPSVQRAPAAQAPTRTVIETTEPFVAQPGDESLWQLRAYCPQPDGTVTETILDMREPLRAGQLKIVKAWLDNRGAVLTDEVNVGMSVTLDWHDAGHHEVPL